MQQKPNESAKDYISRVDLAVSTLTKLGEPISQNTWIFTLVNGLRPEYDETRTGVNFARAGFQSVVEVKKSILNEENVIKTQKGLTKTKTDTDKADTAFFSNEHRDEGSIEMLQEA